MTARAPRARARTTSAPRRTPPSSRTSIRLPTASTISGSASMVARVPSSWRPPWFDTTRPSMPCSAARRASAAVITPFRRSGPDQRERNHARSAQAMDGSTCRLATPARVTMSVRGAPGRADEIRQRQAPLAHQHPPHPSRPPQRVHDVPRRHAGRNGEPVPEVPLPAADHLHVDGQEERAVSGRPGPLDEGARQVAVLPHVQLEPERPGRPRRHLLDRAARVGAERVDGAPRRARRAPPPPRPLAS